MGYVASALLIGLAILIHELGHLIAAWIVKIPVARFSVGIGPKLWSVQRGQTEYWLSAIPLGGYVLPAVQDHEEFQKIPVSNRLFFTIAGPLANVLLSLLCFALYNVIQDGFSLAGVTTQPFAQLADLTGRFLAAIPALFSGDAPVSGIVGIVAVGEKVIDKGVLSMIMFLNLLSLNLAVLNMLPMPPLDGGKIMMFLLEKIDRRLLKVHEALATIGVVLLLGLMVYATYGDVRTLLSKEPVESQVR